MKYCDFNGCSCKISKGRYCPEHAASKKLNAKRKTSIITRTNHSIEQALGKKLPILYIKEKTVAVRDVANLYLDAKPIGFPCSTYQKKSLLKLEPNNIQDCCVLNAIRLKKMMVKLKSFRELFQVTPIKNNFFVITEDRVAGGTCKVAQDF